MDSTDSISMHADHSYAKQLKDPIKLPSVKRRRISAASVLSDTSNVQFEEVLKTLVSNSSEARDRGKAKLRTLKPGSNTVVSHSSDKSSSEARDRGKAKSRTLKPGSSVQVLFNSHSLKQQ